MEPSDWIGRLYSMVPAPEMVPLRQLRNTSRLGTIASGLLILLMATATACGDSKTETAAEPSVQPSASTDASTSTPFAATTPVLIDTPVPTVKAVPAAIAAPLPTVKAMPAATAAPTPTDTQAPTVKAVPAAVAAPTPTATPAPVATPTRPPRVEGYIASTKTTQGVGPKAKLIGPNGGAIEEFGYSVAIDGDTAVIGAPSGQINGRFYGLVYVFTLSDGAWSFTAQLTAGGFSENSRAGLSVAIDGDTIVVGAPGDYNRLKSAPKGVITHSRSGSAYVFTKPSGGWVSTHEAAKLVAPDLGDYRGFGYSVAVNGDTVVVGSEEGGAAYVFTKPGGGWVDSFNAAKLTAPGEARLGNAVDIDGDTIAVGGGTSDANDPYSASVVHVFTKPAGGWANSSRAVDLTTPYTQRGNGFGLSVSFGGDTLVVGAPLEDGKEREEGAAYVFSKTSEGWTSTSSAVRLTSPDGGLSHQFGKSAAVEGDRILIGSRRGAAYVFTRLGGSDDLTLDRITSPDGDAYGWFGWTLDLDGDTAVIGSPYFGDSSRPGSVYLVQLGSTPDLQANIAAASRLVHPNTETTSTLIVANLGTVAAMGVTIDYPLHAAQRATVIETTQGSCAGTVVVTCDLGALAPGAGATITATVRIASDAMGDIVTKAAVSLNGVDLNPANNSASAVITVVDPSIRQLVKWPVGWYLPYGVAPMDFDGESLVFGVPGDWGGSGTAYVSSMPKGGWGSSTPYPADLNSGPLVPSGVSGSSVAVDGDTLVVGAPQDHESGYHGVQRGSAQVFTRSALDVAQLTRENGSATDRFGSAVAVDGDTIVVGARKAASDRGRAYVFSKPRDGWISTSSAVELSAPDAEYGDEFGYAVAVDGDTVVVGAPGRNSPVIGGRGHFADKPSGAAYVFTRSGQTWSLAAKLTERSGDERSWFGSSVSIDGDMIVVGAFSANNVYRPDRPGAAYVFTKPSGGWGSTPSVATLTAGDAAGEDFFGLSVSVSGDTVVVGSSSGGYLFTKPVGGWEDTSNSAKFVASDAAGERHSATIHGNAIGVSAALSLYVFELDRTP